ncbi:MAG: hypothetical protein E7074_06440 [Bacteroidales bacterium]|nr:hypothetical protein [Bacteroidales bacterium]
MPEVQVNFGAMRRYMPAVLKSNTNGFYIEYYAYNQITDGLERKRMKLNRERKKARNFAEFRSMTTQMIIQINCQLASGWSPFAISSTLQVQPTMPVVMQPIQLPSQQVLQQYAAAPAMVAPQQPVDDGSVDMLVLIDKFLKAKKRDLTENTMRSYESFCNGLKKWIVFKHPDLRSNEFTQRLAVEYMDYVLEGNNATKNGKARKHEDGTVSNRTYNNNLKQGRALFSWAVEKCYCEKNPFEKIKTKREEVKTRVLIPEQWRSKIKEYFEKTNPQYLIICELVHTSLIRPVEISRLHAYMVNIEESCIELPANITKNHKERRARLSEELKEMLSRHIMGAKPEDYLFADKCWRCGTKPMSSHTYGNVWEAMRKEIHLPEEMQLYSLRDTGINGMLKAGIDPLSVMQAADHSDLSMTTRYANHVDPELFKTLNEKAPKF